MSRLEQDTFREVVNRELRLFVCELGFREGVSYGQLGGRFEGEALVLDVVREFNSDMVFFDFFRKDTKAVYGLGDILMVLSPETAKEAHCSSANVATLRQGLKRIAGLCENELRGVFELDKAALDKIDVHVSVYRHELTLAARFGNRFFEANTAWEKKDWASALALYGVAEEALAPYQKRRLEYLRKRLPST